jgi:hypothetical protein
MYAADINAMNATTSTRYLLSSSLSVPKMPRDPFIREEFTKDRSAARAFAKDYFERYPKD